MTTVREGRVTVNRLSIHTLTWDPPGAPAAPPLLLLHGFMDHAWSFLPFVEALQERTTAPGGVPRKVVAINLRGHGDSGWVQGGYYHFSDYVLDVIGVSDAIGADRFSLLGHSMGGMAACLVSPRSRISAARRSPGPGTWSTTISRSGWRKWCRHFSGRREAGRAARRGDPGV